jgi:hypothetical protein
MFGALVTVAALGALAAWGWMKAAYEGARPQPSPQPRLGGAPVPSAAYAAGVEAMQRRMAACGATAADLAATNQWTAQWFGNVIPLRDRLDRMRQTVPYTAWPAYAQRVWCAFGPLQPLPGLKVA